MALDKVKPLKLETTPEGNANDVFPTEVDPTQDYIAAKGISFKNSDTSFIDNDATGDIQFTDPNYNAIQIPTIRTPDKYFAAEAIAEQSSTSLTAVNALTLTINQAIPAGKYLIQSNWQWQCSAVTSNFNAEFYMTVGGVKTLFCKQLTAPFNGANYDQNSAWKIVTLGSQNANNVVIKLDYWHTVGAGIFSRIKEARLSFWRIQD